MYCIRSSADENEIGSYKGNRELALLKVSSYIYVKKVLLVLRCFEIIGVCIGGNNLILNLLGDETKIVIQVMGRSHPDRIDYWDGN